MALIRDASVARATVPGETYAKLSPGPGVSAAKVGVHQRARIHGALIDLVAEQGYEAVTVRDLVRLSGVSSRAFYKHFIGKEECFLRTHELVVRCVTQRIVAAQADRGDWYERLRIAFATLGQELERNPRSARLVLIEVYGAGPTAIRQAWRAECTFEALVSEIFARAPDGLQMPPLLVKGIVAGTMRMVRARLLHFGNEFSQLAGELSNWSLSYRSKAVVALVDLDRLATPRDNDLKRRLTCWRSGESEVGTLADDRALILSAVAKLVAGEGYGSLSLRSICVAAGVSPRKFKACFEGVEDCFVAAVKLRADEAFTRASRAQFSNLNLSAPDGVCQAIFSLSAQIASDSTLASLCFSETLAPGIEGVRCQEDLMVSIAKSLQRDTSSLWRSDEFALEASVGAAWGVLQHCAVATGAFQAQRVTGSLSYLLLAPVVGPKAAVAAFYEASEVAGKRSK